MKKATVNLTWSYIEFAAKSLAEAINATGVKYDGIVGIARGGVIPAVLVAGRLGVRTLKTIQVSKYTNGEPGSVSVENACHGHCLQGRWLIVDDIVGTGDTMNTITSILPRCDFCTLLVRPYFTSPVMSGCVLPEETGWVVFPWEIGRKEDGVFTPRG